MHTGTAPRFRRVPDYLRIAPGGQIYWVAGHWARVGPREDPQACAIRDLFD